MKHLSLALCVALAAIVAGCGGAKSYKITGVSADVAAGDTLRLFDYDTDEEITYTIVGENESDSKNGRVSITSPIARALIGKRIGDEAVLNAPKGKRNLKILNVKFLSTDTWTF